MKKVAYILLFFMAVFYSCNTSKLAKEYKLYQRDKTINYPKENLSIKLANDTTGLFVNNYESTKVFNQDFVFSKIKDDYLIIRNVSQSNPHLISFKQGDTIVLTKGRLLFFYNGDKKYLLSFKKK